jgi:hypothetical protein
METKVKVLTQSIAFLQKYVHGHDIGFQENRRFCRKLVKMLKIVFITIMHIPLAIFGNHYSETLLHQGRLNFSVTRNSCFEIFYRSNFPYNKAAKINASNAFLFLK